MNPEKMREYRAMVGELLDLESGLTNWEIDFLDSLHDWEADEYTLKQIACLQKIYDKLMMA